MEKRLEDYIGYYLDHPITIKEESYQTESALILIGIDLSSDRRSPVCHVLDAGTKLSFYVNLSEVKLILFPMHAVIPEELDYIRSICFSPPAIQSAEALEQTATFVHELRRRGYDVDGLIPAGHAVVGTDLVKRPTNIAPPDPKSL